jgi:peptidoglycan hydrolase-like protein with peptidoglycan-binding domain
MNQAIKDLQSFLKTTPLGIAFSGKVDGIAGPDTIAAANNLQNAIKQKLPEASSLVILSGENVVTPPAKLKELMAKISKPEDKENDKKAIPVSVNQNIKAMQESLNSNPFGITYNGPKDGVINKELVAALQQLETKIQSITGANVAGKIISGENIITTPDDLNKTFKLIASYQKFLTKSK